MGQEITSKIVKRLKQQINIQIATQVWLVLSTNQLSSIDRLERSFIIVL